jgi:hypothetical protein
VEDQDRIEGEGEGEDTEAHKLSVSKHDVSAAGEPKGEDEGDEPDVEGHKLANKFDQ